MNRDEYWARHSKTSPSDLVSLYNRWDRPLPPDLQAAARSIKKAHPELPGVHNQIYAAVKNALMIYGYSGSGKSKLLGHDICFWNAEREVGTLLIDPIGGAINWFLGRVSREQPELEENIIYCNMAGQRIGNGEVFVPSWPLLYRRFPTETHYEMANRYIDITARTEQAFRGAPIQGLSRFSNILTNLSMVLGALELPLLDAVDLLRNHRTKKWQERLARAEKHPDDSGVRFAVSELQHFFRQKPYEQNQQIEPLINRLAFLWHDEISQVMFSNNEPAVDLDDVVSEGKIVLLDFSSAFTGKIPEFRLFWVWSMIQEWAASRPANQTQQPLTILMDELSYFTNGAHLDIESIISEFNAFLQQRRRNSNIRFVGATQDMRLLPATEGANMQQVVQQIPSQLYAKVGDPETAMQIAERYYDYSPYKVKQEHIGYHSEEISPRVGRIPATSKSVPYVSSVEYVSKEEQITKFAQILMNLKDGEWMLAEGRGNRPAADLTRIHLPRDGAGFDRTAVAAIKQGLARRSGIPVKETIRRQVARAAVDHGAFPAPVQADAAGALQLMEEDGHWQQHPALQNSPAHELGTDTLQPADSNGTPESGDRFGDLPV